MRNADDEQGAAGCVGVLCRVLQERQKMRAIGQAGQRVAIGFAAHRFEARSLVLEQPFETDHRAVHRRRELAEFRNVGLVDGGEAAFGDGLGLGDDGR